MEYMCPLVDNNDSLPQVFLLHVLLRLATWSLAIVGGKCVEC